MELHASVTEFFHEAVTNALRSKQVEAQDATEFYLVHLLVGFTSAPHLDEEPLALRMAQAQAALPEERARTLKAIGDTSLYMSGFFADALTRKLVDVDYYIEMGGAAYGQLARAPVPRTFPEHFRDAFDELAAKFRAFVDVLSEVRSHTAIASSTNVLRLCEEWVRTGSDWIERRLRATGLLPAEVTSGRKVVS